MWSTTGLFARRPSLVIAALILVLFVLDRITSPPRVHVRHSNLDFKTKTLFRERAVNNTLIVVPVNTGMLYWVDNLLCSLHHIDFDTKSVVFWTLDKEAKTILDNRGHATYHDPTLFSVSSNENTNGATRSYGQMMSERPKFFIDVLSAGFDMLMIDADTIWYQSPLMLRDNTVDAVFSTDAREFYQESDAFSDRFRRGGLIPPICAGVFWMKAGAATVSLYQDMLNVMHSGWKTYLWRKIYFQDDQRGLDCLLNDGRAALHDPLPAGITSDMLQKRTSVEASLQVRLMDQAVVTNGHLLKNRAASYEKYLAETKDSGKDRIAVHINWSTKEMTKEAGSRQFGLWLLDDQNQCKKNQTLTR